MRHDANSDRKLLILCGCSGKLAAAVIDRFKKEYEIVGISRNTAHSTLSRIIHLNSDLAKNIPDGNYQHVIYVANSSLNQIDSDNSEINWEILSVSLAQHLDNFKSVKQKFGNKSEMIFISSFSGILPLKNRAIYSTCKRIQLVLANAQVSNLLSTKVLILGSLTDGNASLAGPLSGNRLIPNSIKKHFLTNTKTVADALFLLVQSKKHTVFVPNSLRLISRFIWRST